MLVLHGFWSNSGGMRLWAEDSDLLVKSPSQALRSARPHPFAAPADLIAGIHPGKPATAVLLLPSLRSAPLDSPELIRLAPRPAARTDPMLLAWTVPVVDLDPTAALAAFDQPAPDVRYGASVDYLAELAVFARELVERGRDDLAGLGDAAGLPRRSWWARPARTGNLGSGRDGRRRRARGAVTDGPAAPATGSLQTASGRGGLADRVDLPGRPVRRGARRTRRAGRGVAAMGRRRYRHRRPGAGDVSAVRSRDRKRGDARGLVVEAGVLIAVDAGPQPAGPRRAGMERRRQPAPLAGPAAGAAADRTGPGLSDFPRALPALRTACPSGLELDADGAYRFLSGTAAVLDEAGFGVLLPSWWDRRRKLGLVLSAYTPVDGVVGKASKFGREQLVEFRWELAVGDDPLSEEEIAALTETKSPLIRLRGQWVALDTEQLRRGLEFLERKPTGRKTTAEILALAASHPDDVDTPLEVTAVRADGWLGDLLAGAAAASLQPLDPPDGFTATLRPYQQRGLAWLAFLSSLGLGSCLADDMGLGKTVQLLALETLESVQRHQDRGVGPTLLLCPMSLVGNWQQEAARFAPNLRVYAHHGGARLHGEALRDHLERTDLVVSTYTTATRDIDELAEYEWNRVVLDEAQAVKNSLSRAAKAVRRLRAAHRVALTGTPMENRLAELWSIMDFLNPGLLGSSERFRTRYAIPIERHGHTEPAERLRASTRPYILRRLKTDPAIIDDLPEKIEIKQYCQLTTEQASLYQAVVADMMEKIENTEGIERRGNVLAAMAKLKQVCNHPAQLLHDRSPVGRRSGKVIRLEEILEEILAEGDRVLCFTQFTEFAELLVPHLAARFGRAARDIAYLHGGTPRKRRDEMVARFQSGDGPPIFLLSLKAGGTGLNLTAANHVVHLDRWWNPAVENQATDRAFRIGQRRTVQVRKFICTGTLEEKIDEMIEEKKALADLVVTDGEGWLTELSTRDLREVFALSEGAVGE